MRVVVTGAGGFVGRRLVPALAREGHDIVALDRQARDFPGVSTVTGDLLVPSTLRDLSGADAVVHLAAVANPRHASADPTQALAVNVTGTRNVLDAVGPQARVVLASTAYVYAPSRTPLAEDAPVRSDDAYAVSKLMAEVAVQEACPNGGAVITRLFNVYGPGQSTEYVIGRLLDQVSRGEEIRLRSPWPVRDFVFVDDAVEALVASVVRPLEGVQTVNIGTGKGRAIGEVAELARELAGRADPVRYDAPGEGKDAFPVVADVGRAGRLLGWRARHTLDEGLRASLIPP